MTKGKSDRLTPIAAGYVLGYVLYALWLSL